MPTPRSLCTITLLTAVALTSPVGSAAAPIEPDLKGLPTGTGWRFFNRTAVMLDEPGRTAIRLTGGAGLGLAILDGFSFQEGTIEFDVRGKAPPTESYVGLALFGIDETTFDAVYFKPFNFISDDEVRRSRAVQYVAMPTYNWAQLRKRYPGMHERPVMPVPDPAGWFHVTIVVGAGRIRAFVENSSEPCLDIKKLSTQDRGWIAFWVSNGSEGDFANLKITVP
ncbi:hypothetical protein Oter_0020 [Opitutus terrae PB90-1]|uniref:3-keto-disaccharide hydrolase domain-containing protein n=1 Tax=Opitutus terrae (strain DSM 11246 / JCM 15787 / PB90-1) TaxID=452637 RepID=B1ZWI8_OPITP|nr:hypothetical protein Oter_0020 [Opitutus terrae PB90-1]